MNPFALLLAACRPKDLKVTRVAEVLGVKRETVYQWQAGTKRPAPEHLGALIELYGLDAETERRLSRLYLGLPLDDPDPTPQDAAPSKGDAVAA